LGLTSNLAAYRRAAPSGIESQQIGASRRERRFTSGTCEARRDYQQFIAVWDELSRTQKVDLVIPHLNLALIYLAQGKLSGRRTRTSLSSGIGRSVPYGRGRRTHVLLAQIHFQAGDYTQAQLELEAALPKLNDIERSTELSDLGMILASRGDLAEARKWLEASVAVREQADASAPGLGRILANLALVCFRQGDLARARSLHQKDIRHMETAGEFMSRWHWQNTVRC
jgi:tetratricopeptide (TPR) repeat protein